MRIQKGWLDLALVSALGLAMTLPMAAKAHPHVQPTPGSLERCAIAAAGRADLSGTVLVSHKGVAVAQVYRGQVSDPGSQAIGPETRFNIGSASKMFTAVAIGQLVDQEKLTLDEPIGQVVEGLSPEASQVTIRQLLDHTSGLGDFFRPENMSVMLRARRASDILPLIAQDKPAFSPGSRFSYSNSGFALLGVAIERVSGLTYGEYLRQHIFEPAGMTHTGLDPQPLTTLAVGMTYGGMGMVVSPGSSSPGSAGAPPGPGLVLIGPGGQRMVPGTPAMAGEGGPRTLQIAPGAQEGYGSPAGGLFSTATDLDRFAIALEAGDILSHQAFALFTLPQVQVAPASAAAPARYYGLGFGLSDDAGGHWVGHNGGTLGANAEVWFDPVRQWTVVVLANRDPPVATDVMRRIRPLVAGSAMANSCR